MQAALDEKAKEADVSAHTLAIAGAQQKLSAFSRTGFMSQASYVTWVSGNLNIQAAKVSYVFLTPLILAPEENADISIRNYGASGGLTISNSTGIVNFPSGATV